MAGQREGVEVARAAVSHSLLTSGSSRRRAWSRSCTPSSMTIVPYDLQRINYLRLVSASYLSLPRAFHCILVIYRDRLSCLALFLLPGLTVSYGGTLRPLQANAAAVMQRCVTLDLGLC